MHQGYTDCIVILQIHHADLCNHNTHASIICIGELIDLFHQCEEDGILSDCVDNLSRKFGNIYPHIPIGHPIRFYERAQQIVAPTRPSLRGGICVIKSHEIECYRRKTWKPRFSNFVSTSMPQYT